MDLIVLGSGTCVPSLKRSGPAAFLKIGDKNILVDIGPGALVQLLKAGLSYKNIDYVFLTHFHKDHFAELGSLLQALDWTPGFTRKKELVLVGPRGFKNFYKKKISSIARFGPYKLTLKELSKKTSFPGFQVDVVKTIHSKESIAYKFISEGKLVVLSGDCSFHKSLVRFCADADLLLLECSFPNAMKKKIQGHLVSSDCGMIAKQSNAKRLVLTHIYPHESSPDIVRLREVKKLFKNTVMAKDLMKITV